MQRSLDSHKRPVPFQLHGVSRLIPTGKMGIKVAVANDNTYKYETIIPISDEWDTENLRLIGFIAKTPEKGKDTAEVYNCTELNLKNALSTSDINNTRLVIRDNSFVYTEPNASLMVYTLNGTEVENKNLASGTYVVVVTPQLGKEFAQKVVLP